MQFLKCFFPKNKTVFGLIVLSTLAMNVFCMEKKNDPMTDLEIMEKLLQSMESTVVGMLKDCELEKKDLQNQITKEELKQQEKELKEKKKKLKEAENELKKEKKKEKKLK